MSKQTEAISSVIVNTANALNKVEQSENHPEIKASIKKHLIEAQEKSIEFAKKLYSS